MAYVTGNLNLIITGATRENTEAPSSSPSDSAKVASGERTQVADAGDNGTLSDAKQQSSEVGTENSNAQVSQTSAYREGNSVVYVNRDGSMDVHEGGSLAWRANNPGNIKYGDWAVRHGAIGQYETQKGNFAIFSTEEDGTRAHRELLGRDEYQNLTINGVIEKYAPPQENDTVRYQRFIGDKLGLPGDTPLHSLTAAQMDRLVDAIRTFEGWRPRNRLHVEGSAE